MVSSNLEELDFIMEDGMYKDALKALYKTFDDCPKKRCDGMHLHHKIPRLYYKANKIEIDNSQSNLVSLPIYRHILAHYLMWRGANKHFKGLLGMAFHFLITKCKIVNIGEAFDFAFEESAAIKHLSYEEMFGTERANDLRSRKFSYMTDEMRKSNGKKSSETKMQHAVTYECIETGEQHTLKDWVDLLGVKSQSSITNSHAYGSECRGKHFRKMEEINGTNKDLPSMQKAVGNEEFRREDWENP